MRPYGQTRNPIVGAVINRPEVSARTINNGRMICAPTIEESYFWGDFDENRAFLEQFVHEIFFPLPCFRGIMVKIWQVFRPCKRGSC